MRRLLPLMLASALMAPPAIAQIVSGDYGPLVLAVDGDRIAGAFSDALVGNGTPDAPQFRCLFLIEGPLDAGAGRIAARMPGEPGSIAGRLETTPAGVRLTLDSNPPGCAAVAPLAGSGQNLARGASGAAIGGALLTAARAVIQTGPAEDPARTRPWLVRWDPVAVLAVRGDWAEIEYAGGPAPVRGWLRAADLALALARRPD